MPIRKKVFTPILPLFLHKHPAERLFYPSRKVQSASKAIMSVIEGLKYYCAKFQQPFLTAQQLGFDLNISVISARLSAFPLDPISRDELLQAFESNSISALTAAITESEYKEFVANLKSSDFHTFINPKFKAGEFMHTLVDETSLNFPYIRGKVERFNHVQVSFKTEELEAQTCDFFDHEAFHVQQMVDTLNGDPFLLPSRHKGRIELDEKVRKLLPEYAVTFDKSVKDISSIIGQEEIEELIAEDKDLNLRFLDKEHEDFVPTVSEQLRASYESLYKKEKHN